MILTLKDGTSYECTDNSNVTEFAIFVADIDAFVEVFDKMTDENLSSFTLDEEVFAGRTLMETKTYKWQNQLEAHFVTLPTEEQRIIEEIEVRAAQAQDKAEAYDILMGEEA